MNINKERTKTMISRKYSLELPVDSLQSLPKIAQRKITRTIHKHKECPKHIVCERFYTKVIYKGTDYEQGIAFSLIEFKKFYALTILANDN